MVADGAVHGIGVCLGLIGAVTIVVITVRMERMEVTPILVYVIGLVTMLALSDPTATIPFSRKQQTANNAGGLPRIWRWSSTCPIDPEKAGP
jgi:predicted membrane channel-forming protein YqfA (hemolysin III family)